MARLARLYCLCFRRPAFRGTLDPLRKGLGPVHRDMEIRKAVVWTLVQRRVMIIASDSVVREPHSDQEVGEKGSDYMLGDIYFYNIIHRDVEFINIERFGTMLVRPH